MKYLVRKSIIEIVGRIWMPAVVSAQTKVLSDYDIGNMRDDNGDITRDSIDGWLACNTGDFQSVIDYHASIEDGDKSIDIPWLSEEGECAFLDCMYANEAE